MAWQRNLNRYLEIESNLNRIFTRFGYCLKHCIRVPDHGHVIHCGCCKGRYYKKYDLDHPAFGLLKTERERLYGKPEPGRHIKRISPCEYHTLNGCLLQTHKSPVCLGFLCRESIEALRSEHGIWEYDYLGMVHGLEWILTGDLSGKAFTEFHSLCRRIEEKLSTGPG